MESVAYIANDLLTNPRPPLEISVSPKYLQPKTRSAQQNLTDRSYLKSVFGVLNIDFKHTIHFLKFRLPYKISKSNC